MKIGLAVHEFHSYGGHSRVVYELARHLARTEEVHIFAWNFKQKIEGNVFYHPIPSIGEPIIARIYSFWLASFFTQQKRKVDVLSSVGGCMWGGDVTNVQFCGRSWGKVVKQYHLQQAGFRAYYRTNSWKLTDFMEAQPLHKLPANQIVAASKQVAADLKQDYGVEGQVEVIPNAINPAVFNPMVRSERRKAARLHLGLLDTTFTLLFVGEFQRKGLTTVVKALQILKTQGKTNNLQLLCLGDRHPEPFMQLALKLGLTELVQFLPSVTNIQDYYALADLFVFPTLYEPFGMVITEAIACGLPTITSKRAGAADFYDSSSQWLLVDDPGDEVELAAIIERVHSNYNQAEQVTAPLTERVLEWTWEKYAHRNLEVFERSIFNKSKAD